MKHKHDTPRVGDRVLVVHFDHGFLMPFHGTRETSVSPVRNRMSWQPLKHGEPFVYSAAFLGGRSVHAFRARTKQRMLMSATKAIQKLYMYTDGVCREDNEGIEWARGWRTQAAQALRASVAL